MLNRTDRPCADHGWTSFRYKGPYGFIMIGAANTEDALREARRGVTDPATIVTVNNLDIWDAETARYLPVV
jgi:hypothetical protein